MSQADKKKLLMTNVALWVVAALLHPVAHLIPTGTGEPPRILPLLIFWMFLILGCASTLLISNAVGKASDETVE